MYAIYNFAQKRSNLGLCENFIHIADNVNFSQQVKIDIQPMKNPCPKNESAPKRETSLQNGFDKTQIRENHEMSSFKSV